MIVRFGIGKTEPQGHQVEKRRITERVARGGEVGAGMKPQFVCALGHGVTGENRLIQAPISVGARRRDPPFGAIDLKQLNQ